jgi:superfamily II DNA/RNA helicase
LTPHHPDDYVHRIGHGRAGLSGTAITIVAPIDGKAAGAIERLIGQTIPRMGEPTPAEMRDSQRPQRGERPARAQQHNRHRDRKPAHRAKKDAPAQKPSSLAPPAEETESGHLPAFLLRPVSVKA